jgi:hypothetical protein
MVKLFDINESDNELNNREDLQSESSAANSKIDSYFEKIKQHL